MATKTYRVRMDITIRGYLEVESMSIPKARQVAERKIEDKKIKLSSTGLDEIEWISVSAPTSFIEIKK